MQQPPRGFVFAPQNPILRALALIAGLGLFVLMLFLGAVFLAALAALGAATWVGLTVRNWWLGRQGGGTTHKKSEYVEAEYRVVDSRKRNDKG